MERCLIRINCRWTGSRSHSPGISAYPQFVARKRRFGRCTRAMRQRCWRCSPAKKWRSSCRLCRAPSRGSKGSSPKHIRIGCAATVSVSGSCQRARGCDGVVSGAPARARIRQLRMGGCDRLAVLGPRHVRGGRKGRHRLFVRGRRHPAARGAIDCVEGRGNAALRKAVRTRKARFAVRFSGTAGTSTRFSGRFSRTTGGRRRRHGARDCTNDFRRVNISCATPGAHVTASPHNKKR